MQRSENDTENETVPSLTASGEVDTAGGETEKNVRRDRLEELSVQVSELELRLGKMEEKGTGTPVSLPGPVSGIQTGILTPSDVRGMNADEVRENYVRIIESMKNWR